jgi:putative nucleotidyltransferase with HDIG domain
MNNPRYRKAAAIIKNCEKDRVFCRHGLTHSLDVARIAHIMNLEKQLNIPMDVVYAAALLHDIGRSCEYTDGTPHEEAGCVLAQSILEESDYSTAEKQEILQAVLLHRGMPEEDNPQSLPGIIKKADKLSRHWFDCDAAAECFWPETKKNHKILY